MSLDELANNVYKYFKFDNVNNEYKTLLSFIKENIKNNPELIMGYLKDYDESDAGELISEIKRYSTN